MLLHEQIAASALLFGTVGIGFPILKAQLKRSCARKQGSGKKQGKELS